MGHGYSVSFLCFAFLRFWFGFLIALTCGRGNVAISASSVQGVLVLHKQLSLLARCALLNTTFAPWAPGSKPRSSNPGISMSLSLNCPVIAAAKVITNTFLSGQSLRVSPMTPSCTLGAYRHTVFNGRNLFQVVIVAFFFWFTNLAPIIQSLDIGFGDLGTLSCTKTEGYFSV